MVLWPRQWEFLGAFAAAWAVLYLLSTCCGLVSLVATALLAMVLADLGIKIHDTFCFKRETIPDVNKKAVFITGCDSGFGFQLAGRLASLGFKVFAGCLSLESEGAKKLSEKNGIRVLRVDVTKQEDIDEIFKKIKEDIEVVGLQLWSVINNAGISKVGEVELQAIASYRQVFEVNALGPVMVTKTFLPLIRAAGQGRIVNVASQAGRFTLYGMTSYSMSKYAIVSFSEGLRLEMKKWNITVHTVEPAFYKTEMVKTVMNGEMYNKIWEDASEELKEAYGREFFDDRVEGSMRALEAADPAEKVYEVIDDLVDAVAGTQPKIRYVPGTKTKIMQRIFRLLPFEVIDRICMTRVTKAMPRAARRAN